MKRRTVLAGLGATAAAGVLGMPSILKAQAPVTLNGAVQFNDDHAFTKALVRFEELVKKYGDDVGKMARDIKINYMQRSEGDLKKRIKTWREAGGKIEGE